MSFLETGVRITRKGYKLRQRLNNPETVLYLLYAEGLTVSYQLFAQVDIFDITFLDFPSGARVRFAELITKTYTVDSVTRSLFDILDNMTHFAIKYDGKYLVYYCSSPPRNMLHERYYIEIDGEYTRDTWTPPS